ncbi:MAG: ABC transporter permease subunit [bacterium]|nr:ABC transporter permease subunit [bacterium]
MKGKKDAVHKKQMFQDIRRHKALYIMVIPGVIYFIIFKYIPLLGNIIAFQDYDIFDGFWASKFVGLKHFKILFQYRDFQRILGNTLIISFYDLIFGFTAPLILALLINEIGNGVFKKVVQQVVYLPHFLSWTIMGGIVITQLLSPSQGLINLLLQKLGYEPIYFMIQPQYARAIVVLSGIWRDTGYGTVVYLAAMTAVSPSLYEAAALDGAGKFKQLLYITLPSIVPIVITLFLIRIGHFMDFGFERIWVFSNASTTPVLETFDTYIYKAGILEGRFSYTTAIGVFKSIVGFIFLFFGNKLSRKFTGEGLY